jgi:hypothetical protein
MPFESEHIMDCTRASIVVHLLFVKRLKLSFHYYLTAKTREWKLLSFRVL